MSKVSKAKPPVVTKDDDFVQAFLLTGEPSLLLISTGNIANNEIEKKGASQFERSCSRIFHTSLC